MKSKCEKILQKLYFINDLAVSCVFVLLFVTVITNVFLRYFFSFSFLWGEELVRYCYIYMIFLGVPIAYRERINVSIMYFSRRFFSDKIRYWLDIFFDLIIAITITFIIYHTIIMIMGKLGSTRTQGLRLPMGYVYAAVIIGYVLVIIEIVIRFIKGKDSRDINFESKEIIE